MGIKDRKERDRQEMRDNILEVASNMFLEEGYDKTSIRNIADKIEYSAGTIYQYFKDKDDIFLTIHRQAFDKLFTHFNQIAQIEDCFERLYRLGYIYIKFALENPKLYDLMFIMHAPMNALKDELWDCGHSSFDFLYDLVQECIEKKRIKMHDTQATTMLIWATVHGLVSLHIRNRYKMIETERIEQIIMQALDEMMEAIKSPPVPEGGANPNMQEVDKNF